MSKELEIIEEEVNYCSSCTYRDSCKLLKFLNDKARTHMKEPFDKRFFCSFYEVQPSELKPFGR